MALIDRRGCLGRAFVQKVLVCCLNYNNTALWFLERIGIDPEIGPNQENGWIIEKKVHWGIGNVLKVVSRFSKNVDMLFFQ